MMAASVGGAENTSLVLNSPFSFLTTMNVTPLEYKSYFKNEDECEQYFSPKKRTFENHYFSPPETQNIVLIILEGISSEYSTFLSSSNTVSGYTPFLDSLAKNSIVFRGMANGQQSIEALPSILGGTPSLLTMPFTQSQFASNFMQYPEAIIKKKGLHTVFFHGGKNGTMGFDNYCQLIGIDQYNGLDEYPYANRDFDGTWGIPDMPYLQYVVNELNTYSSPFFAAIFTLSSHHPFVVPEPYNHTLPTGDFPMQHAVAYTDKALEAFFQQAAQTDWFEHTLFVITSDHTNFSGDNNIDYQAYRYAIPIIFYHPKSDTAFVSDRIMQQTDIMPSLFAYCHWAEPFFSFGNNIFDTTQTTFAINYNTSMYNLYVDKYLIEFDGQNIVYIWDLMQTMPRTPISAQSDLRFEEYEKKLKAVIQQFNNRMIDNRLTLD